MIFRFFTPASEGTRFGSEDINQHDLFAWAPRHAADSKRGKTRGVCLWSRRSSGEGVMGFVGELWGGRMENVIS